jgi:hypothetical protein
MKHSRQLDIAQRLGAWLTLGAGALWETFEVSHNLSYIVELISHFELMTAATSLFHIQPFLTMALGLAWVLLGSHRKEGGELIRLEPAIPDLRLPEIKDDGEYEYKLEHERRDGSIYEKTTVTVSRHR